MLAGSLTACGDQAGEGQTQDPESKTESGGAESKEESGTANADNDEIVKLQMLSLPSNSSGIVEG